MQTANPSDLCTNPSCGHMRWRHARCSGRTAHCKACASVHKCKQFRKEKPRADR